MSNLLLQSIETDWCSIATKVDGEDDQFMKVAEASVKSNAEANNYLFLDFVPLRESFIALL